MDNETELSVAQAVLAWCNHCRLHAAKVVIWNAELDELEQIVKEASDYLPADITGSILRSKIDELSVKQLRAVRGYITTLLESKSDED